MKNDNNKKNNLREDEAVVKEEDPTVLTDEEADEIEKTVDYDTLSPDEALDLLKKTAEENAALIAETAELKEKLGSLTDDSAKFKDNWYRTAAEFENFKKRNEFTRRNAYDDGVKDAVLPILNIGDSIDRALSVELDEKTKEGVMLIKRQFIETLAAIKIEEIDPEGEFDPNTSEAIATLPTDEKEKDGTIAQVYKKGFVLNGKILRYAQVVVYKSND